MQVALWVFAAAAAVVATDEVGRWAERRGWIYWHAKRAGKTGAAGSALVQMNELFSPSIRNTTAERESKRISRVDTSTGVGVDLDSETAYVTDVRRRND